MLLIDGNPVLYKAWFKYALETSKGEPSNLVYGALKILGSLFKKFSDQGTVTLFWDLGQSSYRVAKYPEYKQTPGRRTARSKEGYPPDSFGRQAAAVKGILEATGVRQVQVRGVEADDLIAIATTTGCPPYTIITDDVDLWQLVGDGVRVYSPRKDLLLSTREDCQRELGFFPEQILDYKALAGDSSDNIPGAPGIGEKRARKLLEEFGNVPALYENLKNGGATTLKEKMIEKLLAEEDKVRLWYDLCQPLSWDMLTEEQQKEFLLHWQAIPTLNKQELIQHLEEWELREFLSDLEFYTGTFLSEDSPQVISVDTKPPLKNGFKALNAIHHKVLECSACSLRSECKMPVPGNVEDISSLPKIMVVGRNPGVSEDRQGRGFVGASGKRLDKFLKGLDDAGEQAHDEIAERSKMFVTNVCHCYSIGNRPPAEKEWKTCAALHLREEIRAIQPDLVLSFGAEAMKALTGFEDSVMQRSGTIVPGREADGIVQFSSEDGERRWDPVIPETAAILICPHPSAALRMKSAELTLRQCGKTLAAWLRDKEEQCPS